MSQQVQGVDRPVLYISRKLSEREGRCSTVEKECVAVRWAVGSITSWDAHSPSGRIMLPSSGSIA